MNYFMLTELAVNIFLLSSSVLLIVIAMILWAMKLPVRRLFLLGLFIFPCGIYFLSHNPTFSLMTGYPALLSSVDIYSQYAITFFSLTYIRDFSVGWRRKLLRGCQIWTLIFIFAVSAISLLTDLPIAAFTLFGITSNVIFMVLFIVSTGWDILRRQDSEALVSLLSSTPLIFCGLAEVFNFISGSVVRTSLLYFTGVVIFMFIQLFWYAKWLREHLLLLRRTEQELAEARVSVMLSQIQPHFLYNSLASIKELCDAGEQQATSSALEHFAYYLRGNMDSLSDTRLIPFTQEVSHVKDYLYLEKMRFEDRLTILWELHVTDFLLPALTLQPIVENAVRHGITEKKGGGTLTVRSEETDDSIIITVTDDGVGFDINAGQTDDRPHIGIRNVESRLRMQCGGKLLIESKCGIGTTAQIILPEMEVC